MAGPGVISLIRNDAFSSLVLDELTRMKDDRVLTDFTICSHKTTIPCHRLVLSLHSPMIKALVASGMTEAARGSVNLNNVDGGVLRVLVEFMYTGQACFHGDQLRDIILACDYLQMGLMKEMCIEQVPSILNHQNVISWLKLSHQLNLPQIRPQCMDIIGGSFVAIYKQPEFGDLSFGIVKECLTHAQSTGNQHDHVLDATLGWVELHKSERLRHVDQLMKQQQLHRCSGQGLVGAMRKYKEMVMKIDLLYDQLTSATEDVMSSTAKSPTRSRIVIVSGDAHGKVSGICWKLRGGTFEAFASIPFRELQSNNSVCKTVGGFVLSGGRESRLCIMFSVATGKWTRLQDLIVARHSHGSIAIKGVVYALGGCVWGQACKSVHSLAIDGQEAWWKEETHLPICLKFPKVESIDERVFVFDESNGRLFQMNTGQKEWSELAALPRRTYYGSSMTSFDGKLYVAGRQLFALYCPILETWIQGSKPHAWHSYGALVAFNSKLVLLGGNWQGGTELVEELDFENHLWKVIKWKMPSPLCWHHALTLDFPVKV